MKKPNRRSKQTSVADASPSVADDKQHHEKRIHDLELENRDLKREIEELRHKLANVSSASDVGVQKLKEDSPQKLNGLEQQVTELKKKLDVQSQFSAQKHRIDEAAKQFPDEIQRLKAQKVQLQCKMKLESVQYRLCKALLEKEILQLKKEQRRKEYEMHTLVSLNQRQKLVLQRKTEEAFMATKRLKELLESRKASSHRTAGARKGNSSGIQGIERELEVTMQVHEVCKEYESEMEEMADEIHKLRLEAEMLKEENSRCLLQNDNIDCRVKDSELRDLKEELARLSSLVSQMEMPKAQLNHRERSQAYLVQSSVPVGSSTTLVDMDTSESERCEGVIATTGTPASGVCCSCSKKSLCKTMKCGCRAVGSGCGLSCGCATSKCTNREAVLIKLDNSLQSEKSEDTVNCSGIIETEKRSILASEGEMLLENASVEKRPEMNIDCGPRKKPLCDIGNTQIKSNGLKPGHRKKGQKTSFPA